MSQRRVNGFRPAPHANAAVHRRIMAGLRKMTPEEVFQTCVKAGIYTTKGRLSRHYTASADAPTR